MFRELNEWEKEAFEKSNNRGTNQCGFPVEDYTVAYKISGDHTIAFLSVTGRTELDELRIGVSKFNRSDKKFDEEIGQRIAFVRALK